MDKEQFQAIIKILHAQMENKSELKFSPQKAIPKQKYIDKWKKLTDWTVIEKESE